MIRSRHQITLGDGVKVEMLFTPSMYERGRERNIIVAVEDQTNPVQVSEAYTKLMYLGAINAWEAKRLDNPDMGDFPHAYIDFAQWSGDNPREFSRMVEEIFQCLTGKTVKDAEDEAKGVKKKRSSM